MILFPNAKINIGLYVVNRRTDGYHDIESVMIPTGWTDVLEITPAAESTSLTITGRHVDCPTDKNLVMKAYRALDKAYGPLPHADIRLHKIIPDGAGLGGGSADAAFTLIGLNEVFALGLSREQLATVAATIGADCAFFIYNRPALCTGIGDKIDLDIAPALQGYTLLIAKPATTAVSTAQAYAGIKPRACDVDLKSLLATPPTQWHGQPVNHFEESIFPLCPEISSLKAQLYHLGATYAAMTGSGASVFALFNTDKMAHEACAALSHCDTWTGPALP
jgi:4-diphosphocytidyl-2-C-methyl-D-erythritol kinase